MKKSVFRLITVCAALALLTGAMLCFSLTSSAENLLTDDWAALDESQASAVTYVDGVLTIDAATGGVDVRAAQTVNLEAGTYKFVVTKEGGMSFTAKWSGGEATEVKYDEGYIDFTLTAADAVTIVAYQYRGTEGTATDMSLELQSGGSGTTATSASSTESSSAASETSASSETSTVTSETSASSETSTSETKATSAPSDGNYATENWQAEDAGQAALVTYADGVLTLDASGGVDVKAAQTVSLPAGSYRFAATKTGEPSPDLSVRTSSGTVAEGKYEEAGHVDFTLTTAEEVTLKVSEYRGGIGTLSAITLTAVGSTPSSETSSAVSETSAISSETSAISSETSAISSETSATAAPASGNLIVNGAFNNGLDGWTLANLDDTSAKVVDGALVIDMKQSWHAAVKASINGTIKSNTQYTIKYDAADVNNLQVRVHKSDGDGSGASQVVEPGTTTFTTDGLSASANFYITIEAIADGDIAGTFDNFILVEGTNTDVTESAQSETGASQSGTNATQAPSQSGKIIVWSGVIGRDFTTKSSGLAIVNEDALVQAMRNDLAANGAPVKYEVEANATYVSGASGYACWGFYQDSPYLEIWSDKGSSLTSAIISAGVSGLNNSASLCLWSEGGDDIVNVQSLTLYAYREGGTVTSETTPSASETTPAGSETNPSTSETTPTNPNGGVLVWSGNLNTDYTTVNGVAVIDNQDMMTAVMTELLTNGVPEKIEIKSELAYLGGDSGYAAIGLYSNGQVIWPTEYADLTDVTFADLSGLGEDTALVVFSGGSDTLHIGNMEIYAYRAAPTPTETGITAISGDANGDGAVNMKDVLALRKFLADMAPAGFDVTAADVNRDGVVNMKDVLKIRKFLADLDTLD